MSAVRAVILGHWGGNIGHEIMAVGVEELVSRAFPGCSVRRIEQHRPLDVYPEGSWLRSSFLRHGRGGALSGPIKAFLNSDAAYRRFWPQADVGKSDVAIACGGPLITGHISESDLGLMYHHLHGVFKERGRAMMNLSVGSCFPVESPTAPSLKPADVGFMKRVFSLSTVTTVRDRVALDVCRQIGEEPEVVPDTGFLSGHYFRRVAEPGTPDVIAINYQEKGANEDWGQNVSAEAWASAVKGLINRLKTRHKVVFVCHGAAEAALAARLDSTVPRFEPKTGDEYARFVPTVKAALCNRLHAAIGMAGYGIPVSVVGTDSRLKTIEEVGLSTWYVKSVTVEGLEAKIESMAAAWPSERERLRARHDKSMDRYVELLRTAAEERK